MKCCRPIYIQRWKKANPSLELLERSNFTFVLIFYVDLIIIFLSLIKSIKINSTIKRC